MFGKRIRIFVILTLAVTAVCLTRLAHMQIVHNNWYRRQIEELKDRAGSARQLKTLRGKILDRNGQVLACDEAAFEIAINYELCKFAAPRVQRALQLRAARSTNPEQAAKKNRRLIETKLEDIDRVVSKCIRFGIAREQVESTIRTINDRIWRARAFLAWRREYLDPQLVAEYGGITSIPISAAMADFKKKQPDEDERIIATSRIDIPAMREPQTLFKLRDEQDIFTAQLEFLGTDGITISSEPRRSYPFGPVACQTIGWVGPEHNKELFAHDRLSRYLEGEVSGRPPGVEYVCEAILRGRRGEVVHNIDGQLVSRIETKLGADVKLTLDIELQKHIEELLGDYPLEPHCAPGRAAAVIEVATGDILAMVSLPRWDINQTRYIYNELVADPDRPMSNRAIHSLYPPGSVVKPLILTAAIESGKATPETVISCPARKAPKGWPSCWVIKFWRGHDDQWTNNARNAIKGSCNVYFSRLADRLDPRVLQQWLFNFGYGRQLLDPPAHINEPKYRRNLRQAAGYISSTIVTDDITDFEQVPPLESRELRWFGIGQGNLRVTPLQVATAMATIARGGLFKNVRLYLNTSDTEYSDVFLDISPQTLNTIREGMHAVVAEQGGTAYSAFADTDFNQWNVKVYGKTGSTEDPENAWFAGFAEDAKGQSVAVAVVIEGGQSGGHDAAPLGKEVIKACIQHQHLGNLQTD